MPMRMVLSLTAIYFCRAALGADATTPRPLTETWAAESGSSGERAATWIIDQKSDAIRMTEKDGTEIIAEFERNSKGRDCQIKDSGKKATVSIWFNGPKLSRWKQ